MSTPLARIVYYVATTLDGQIAHNDGSYDGFVEAGPHVDAFISAINDFDAVLMGRKTYETGLSAGLPLGQPAYAGRKNYVFTQTLKLPADVEQHTELQLVSESAAPFVAKLKDEMPSESKIWLCGGGELASALLDAGLVDELILKINPTLFGSGRPVAAGLVQRRDAELVECRTYVNGVLVVRYRLVAAAA